MLFKYARKTQNLRILRGKLSQNVIFSVENFFQNLLFKITFSTKSCFLKNIFLQILTRCKIFNSQSDAL